MSKLLANAIRVLHLLLIVFVVCTPFLFLLPDSYVPEKLWPLLILHFTVCLSLLVHWKFNNDTCFLTVVESTLRGVPMQSSFMHSIVSPVYKIQNDTLKDVSNIAVPVLMGLVLWQLVSRRKEVMADIHILTARVV